MKRPFIIIAALLSLSLPLSAGNGILADFADPPREYRPRVWWHWMNGNITEDGIRKDIEWMDAAGIVGFHIFDAGFDTPQIVDERLPYMSEGWKKAFNLALDMADSLNMEVSITSSPGWSLTGGPWVTREDAMKKIVWTEKYLNGGKRVTAALEKPAVIDGFYKDVAVIAVRLPGDDLTMEEMGAALSASDSSEEYPWIMVSLDKPYTIKAYRVTLPFSERYNYSRTLECSDDGIHFRTVSPRAPETVSLDNTIDIPATTARYFRFRSTIPHKAVKYNDIILYCTSRVNAAAEKAGFTASYSVRDFYPTPERGDAISFNDVIDVTGKVRDGVLEWKAPAGKWCVYRFGYALTGRKNGPASPEATGLEVDKFDSNAVQRYFRNYYGMYQEASKGRLGTVISNLMIDSYESGCQNWTAAMPEEFKARRGYSLIPWMPALAGRIIGDSASTERFLYDWRRTLEELIAENHYDGMSGLNREYGLTRQVEAQEYSRVYNADGMDVRRHSDIPMGSFWMREFYSSYPCEEADMREAASVAHIYGQNVCAGESFTTNGEDPDGFGRRVAWALHPGNLKPAADAAMASGQNRFVIHSLVHQPVDDKVPGLTLSKHGMAFNRHNTWAAEARPWTDYLSRSSYLLSQGRFVADMAVFYSETTNAVARFKQERPEVPDGYAYDFINKTVLTSGIDLPYKVVIIDKEVRYMSVPVLRRFAELARKGILLVGNEPEDYCDLMGDDSEFHSLVNEIWHSGRMNVIARAQLENVLRSINLRKDADIPNPTGADIRFVHRRLDDGELYWVANINPEYRKVDATFRVSGKKPFILHADSGLVEEAAYHISGDCTTVSLELLPDDAQFILFEENTDKISYSIPPKTENRILEIQGPWKLSFPENLGAPESAEMPLAGRLDESKDPGIRYFSGTATYCNSFEFGPLCSSSTYILDLGEVYNMARIYLNGKDLGLVWKRPFRVDVTDALAEGTNNLEIRVTNTWHNRIIGDIQPDCKNKITFTTYQFYTAGSPLYESGLEGPVTIYSQGK